jgi:hypothetical protein
VVAIAVEFMAQQTLHVWSFLMHRLMGGYQQAFTIDGDGKTPINSLAGLDPRQILANPELWIGLLVAALFLWAAIRLRRYRDPI